ncbi:MAG: VacJ family lipoprotein [Desulfuromonadales bacterium]|nr:VacJ family lipoprotein [Desulfuromonadales bacterium]
MSGKQVCGVALIAGMLLAGSAVAGERPNQALNNQQSGQVSMVNETTTLSRVALSESSDAVADEKEPVIKTETAPKTVAAPTPEPRLNENEADDVVDDVLIADPIEPLNRMVFQFNDKFYFWALKPVARGYNYILPEPVRISVRNFFLNVKMPIRFVNTLFQGKLKGAGTELARFGINTTIGVAGFFDVAKSSFDLYPYDEDLGQTLGFYGMGGLMYIVWPILGPSTVRDTIGMAGDSFLNPARYISPFEVPLGLTVFEQINRTSLDLGVYEDLIAASVEPYIGVRDAYIQYRKKQINK